MRSHLDTAGTVGHRTLLFFMLVTATSSACDATSKTYELAWNSKSVQGGAVCDRFILCSQHTERACWLAQQRGKADCVVSHTIYHTTRGLGVNSDLDVSIGLQQGLQLVLSCILFVGRVQLDQVVYFTIGSS